MDVHFNLQWNLKEGGYLEENKAKLRNYVQIRNDYSTESYVSFHVKKGQRSLWAQLRAGVLPLVIQVGEYKDIPQEQWLCVSFVN